MSPIIICVSVFLLIGTAAALLRAAHHDKRATTHMKEARTCKTPK
ncbi:hypothetical protein MMA231_02486 [Asticcacaulis sp. MM231]